MVQEEEKLRGTGRSEGTNLSSRARAASGLLLELQGGWPWRAGSEPGCLLPGEEGTCTAANEFINAPCGICPEHWLGAWQRASLAHARPPTLPGGRRDGAGCCGPARSSPARCFTLCPGRNTTASVPAGRATGILGRPAEIPRQKSSPGLTRRRRSSADAAVWGRGSGLCCQGAEPAACQTCSARAKLTQACH